MSSSNSIKVVARFRPQNKAELASGGHAVVEFESDDTCNLQSKEGGSGAYTFDRVFDMDSRQADVFEYSIRSTVDDILNGYNGTVFAYGQTGAGKSYTMMGAMDDPEARGVIPRITEQIFASIMASESNIEYTVKVSYMEIYMERIRDLLFPQSDNLPIHEEKAKGVYVKGLKEVFVNSVDEVYDILHAGGLTRAVASTNMNQESSRSHSIFVITIAQKNVDTGSGKTGQLFLVDLAGSEKVGKTGASGQTLEEAKKINKSLSALGMVINALTDGKSSHIPYRDSKLTRILQESLGGNSRTTLIINCSPSSYNDAETISTLRFGVRAKSIKNNAKVNQEMSPAELKAYLRKAQTQVSTYEEYIGQLEDEVGHWRRGDTVPKEKWTSSPKTGITKSAAQRASGTPGTPNLIQEQQQRRGSEAPTSSRPNSRLDLDRALTPSSGVDRDEKEDFLLRENELQHQLAEKESALTASERALEEARAELQDLRNRHMRTNKEQERLNSDLESLKMQVERSSFETKEAAITMDSLKEANNDLTNELEEVRKELIEAKVVFKETAASQDDKDALKKERMAEMMAGFEIGSDSTTDSDRILHESLNEVDRLLGRSGSGDALSGEDLRGLRQKLVSIQTLLEEGEASQARLAVHEKLAQVQSQYQDLLSQDLGERDIEDVKGRLQASLASSASHNANGDVLPGQSLHEVLGKQREDNNRLRAELEALRKQTSEGVPAVNGSSSKTLQQQLADFDTMKKSLMRDLQNRCERVVELEISLDSTREQYNNVLRSANSKQQQKKLAFLERNLEQLTIVQRQLVEQNATLKKDVAVADRKLVARGERIRGLESLLVESQERLMQANHRFETQLTALKERLEAGHQDSSRNLRSGTFNPSGSINGAGGAPSLGARIAKPLRGGGAAAGSSGTDGGGPLVPTFASLQAQQQAQLRQGDDGGGAKTAGGGSKWFPSLQRTMS